MGVTPSRRLKTSIKWLCVETVLEKEGTSNTGDTATVTFKKDGTYTIAVITERWYYKDGGIVAEKWGTYNAENKTFAISIYGQKTVTVTLTDEDLTALELLLDASIVFLFVFKENKNFFESTKSSDFF